MKEKLSTVFKRLPKQKKARKNFILSVVAVLEVVAIMCVATYAWVETVSSIKISGNGTIDTFVYTDAEIGELDTAINLAEYFKKAGDIHLTPASSADGKDLYFPVLPNVSGSRTARTGTVTQSYRKATTSDYNVNYISVSFRITTSSNADFFFTGVPTISNQSANIRFSVTAQSEGSSESTTKIYALSASSNSVVNSAGGGKGTASVEAITNHTKGKSSSARLFNVTAEETKLVTVKMWLQKTNYDLNSNLAESVSVSNFGIVSDLTPRHVTLVPTGVWNADSPSYYAWMWNSESDGKFGKFYEMTDNHNGSYSFDYDGKYQKLTFVRMKTGTTGSIPSWDDMWNQTEDLTIPVSPVDPTYFVTSMDGGTDSKSAGTWEDPGVIKIDYCDGSTSTMGTIGAEVKHSNVLQTSVTGAGTVLTRAGCTVTSTQTAKTGYQFLGWYDNPEGTGTPVNSISSIPTSSNIVNYYAKFVPVYRVTLAAYLEGQAATSSLGTLKHTVNGTTTTGTGTTYYESYQEGTQVALTATAASGYTFNGISTSVGGENQSSRTLTVGTSPVTYYANFTAKSYNVTASASYSTDGGSTYTTGNSTGGTVKAGTATDGATSTSSVKYKKTVSLVATAASGYEFQGWFANASGGTALSTNTSFTYTLNTAGAVTVYARFKQVAYYLTGFLNGSDESGTTHQFAHSSGTTYTLTYKFTGGDKQYVTVFDGINAYHPGSVNESSGTAATIVDTTPAGPDGNKWLVPAPKGATVTFTWNSSTKTLSWTIDKRTLYLKPTSGWTDSSAWFAAYMFGKGTKWYKMTSAGLGYYSVEVDAKYPNVIFCRMKNTDTSTLSFDNMWNQTGDLTIPSASNCYTVPSDSQWDNPGDGTNNANWSIH